jgi:hypothetical protein
MAKITLGKRPVSFFRTVSEKLVDGTDGEIGITYRYRTRKEFAALLDEFFGAQTAPADEAPADQPEAEAPAPVPVPKTIADVTQDNLEANVDYILKIAIGWDLPDDFCDEQPALALKIMTDYRRAINEGRLGN